MKFSVRYYYLATGMEGHADDRVLGEVDAASADEACDLIAMREYPQDIMYGPNNSYSTRGFFRGCLSATEVGGS